MRTLLLRHQLVQSYPLMDTRCGHLHDERTSQFNHLQPSRDLVYSREALVAIVVTSLAKEKQRWIVYVEFHTFTPI